MTWHEVLEPQTSDLERAFLHGIKPSTALNTIKPSYLPKGQTTILNENISPNKQLVQKVSVEPRTNPRIKRSINYSNDGPPPIINLLAENYKIKLTERIYGCNSRLTQPVKEIRSILLERHEPQNIRSVHFFPEKGDVIPRHAQLFDYDSALAVYNQRIVERQEFAISYAEMVCEESLQKASSNPSTPRIGARIAFDRQPIKNHPTLPIKQPKKSNIKVKTIKNNEPRLEASEFLTVNKVSLTPNVRRYNTSKNSVRKFSPYSKLVRETRNTTRKYSSKKIIIEDDFELSPQNNSPPQLPSRYNCNTGFDPSNYVYQNNAQYIDYDIFNSGY